MANATAVLTVANFPAGVDNTQRRQILYGKVAIGTTSQTYVVGGLPLTWLGIKDASGGTVFPQTAETAPVHVQFDDFSGTGYIFQYNKASNTIQIFESAGSAAPLAELTAIDIPATVAAANIAFKAEFIRNNA